MLWFLFKVLMIKDSFHGTSIQEKKKFEKFGKILLHHFVEQFKHMVWHQVNSDAEKYCLLFSYTKPDN